jgi:hypothetical protein
VLIRDYCGFEPELLEDNFPERVWFVNCDVNDDVDVPVYPDAYRNIFLHHSLAQRHLAEKKGWREFACIPPTSTFFTGLCAILWAVSNHACDGVVCIGLDFNFDYVVAAHAAARAGGTFATANNEHARTLMLMSIVQVLQACIQSDVALSTASEPFIDWLMEAKRVISTPQGLVDFTRHFGEAAEKVVAEQLKFEQEHTSKPPAAAAPSTECPTPAADVPT